MPQNTSFNISASSSLQIDEIQFTFSHWSGASSSSSASLSSQSATEHKSYTATFTAKPLPPTNVLATGSVGNPVRIEWTDNPNSNVTQYQIWRRVKPLGGQQGEPEHVGTVNSGVEEYTDYTFTVTSSYTDYLLTYDVRSYYQVGGSYSDPNWSVTEFGEVGAKVAPGEQGNMKIGTTLPTEFAVSSYPNPFNPSTTISYQLVKEADVHLQIFDLLGRQVAELVNGVKSAGFHSVIWNGSDGSGKDAPTGLYLYRFQASSADGKEVFRKTGKLLLTK